MAERPDDLVFVCSSTFCTYLLLAVDLGSKTPVENIHMNRKDNRFDPEVNFIVSSELVPSTKRDNIINYHWPINSPSTTKLVDYLVSSHQH